MSRHGSPRKPKPSDESAAVRNSFTPVASSRPAEAPLEVTLSHDQLAARAYTLFVARGGQHGDDWRDWFQAEMELRRAQEVGRSPSSH
jgi:hypothetical protein